MKSLAVLFGATLFGILLGIWLYHHIQPSPMLPNITQSISTAFTVDKPPRQSLAGSIATYSGTVNWQSRTATTPAQLSQVVPILQGEILQTGQDGRATVVFDNFTAKLAPNTKLEFSQTLPVNLVLTQSDGSISYTNDGPNPLSIRAAHLLINPKPGSFNLNFDPKLPTLNLTISSGSATVAYNDNDNLTHVLNLPSRQQLNFNDQTKQARITNFIPNSNINLGL